MYVCTHVGKGLSTTLGIVPQALSTKSLTGPRFVSWFRIVTQQTQGIPYVSANPGVVKVLANIHGFFLTYILWIKLSSPYSFDLLVGYLPIPFSLKLEKNHLVQLFE